MTSNVWSEAFAQSAEPRVRLAGSEFADAHRYVGTGPEQGRWRTSRTPYLKEILDVCTDWETERVTMMCSVQVGKTETQLCLLQYYVQAEPAPILFVLPTVDVAKEVSKERIGPMIDATPELAEKLAEEAPRRKTKSTRRKASETLRMKMFPGGFLAMVGANAPSGLASRSIRVVLIDEYDRMENTKEGCPGELAEARTANFHNRKIVTASTPHREGTSKIYREFMAGDQRHLHIPCQHCGTLNVWEMSQIKWEKDEHNNVIPSTIRHECPHCGGVIRRGGKPSDKLLATGVWIPAAPENTPYGKSYHIWKIHSPWVELEEIVMAYVKATRSRDPNQLMTFDNLWRGWPYKEKRAEDRMPTRVYRRREDYGAEVPDGVGVLTCGVDVQGSYLAAEVVGWGVDKESWGIEYRLFAGDPKQPKVWEDLTQFLERPRFFADGREINIAATFIDSGGHSTQEVYRYTASTSVQNVKAIKGASRDGIPYVGMASTVGRERVELYTIGVDHGKDRLLKGWLLLDTPGAGYCHFPANDALGYDAGYFRGLFSEETEETFLRGVMKQRWVQREARNEPLDCRNYAMAAMEWLNPDLVEWVLYYSSDASRGEVQQRASASAQAATRQISKGVKL